MELTKKEYIDRLKEELQVIELRYQHLINANSMLGEDYRSQGLEAYYVNLKLREEIQYLKDTIVKLMETINERDRLLLHGHEITENHEMIHEEDLTRYGLLMDNKIEKEAVIEKLNQTLDRKLELLEVRDMELRRIDDMKKMRKE